MSHRCSHAGCTKDGVLFYKGWDAAAKADIESWFCLDHGDTFEGQINALVGSFCRLESAIPTVGMGATVGVGSDSYAYTIVSVSPDLKTVTVQEDDHKPAPGYDYYANQVFVYTANPDATKNVYTLRKNGRYVLKGETAKGGRRLSVGVRRHHHDPSF